MNTLSSWEPLQFAISLEEVSVWGSYQSFEIVVIYGCLDKEFGKRHEFCFVASSSLIHHSLVFCKTRSVKFEDEGVPNVWTSFFHLLALINASSNWIASLWAAAKLAHASFIRWKLMSEFTALLKNEFWFSTLGLDEVGIL